MRQSAHASDDSCRSFGMEIGIERGVRVVVEEKKIGLFGAYVLSLSQVVLPQLQLEQLSVYYTRNRSITPRTTDSSIIQYAWYHGIIQQSRAMIQQQ